MAKHPMESDRAAGILGTGKLTQCREAGLVVVDRERLDEVLDALRNVKREHDMMRGQRQCAELRRKRFGIATASDDYAREWQELEKRRRPLAEKRKALVRGLTPATTEAT